MATTPTMQDKGTDLGMSERTAYTLDLQVSAAKRAVKEAMRGLGRLQEALDDDDQEVALSELRRLADHVGYSNSVGTAWAELAAAAGAVAALLATI